MSSFIMGYSHHIQSPMSAPIEPKFPPNSDEYQHHNGYGHGGMPAIQTGPDYGIHHQNNSLHHNANNFNYGQGPFYHHHGYNTQMPSITNNGYSPANNGYYSYYGSTNNGGTHQNMDMPLQCSAVEPTNTVLGLQELGKFLSTPLHSYFGIRSITLLHLQTNKKNNCDL